MQPLYLLPHQANLRVLTEQMVRQLFGRLAFGDLGQLVSRAHGEAHRVRQPHHSQTTNGLHSAHGRLSHAGTASLRATARCKPDALSTASKVLMVGFPRGDKAR